MKTISFNLGSLYDDIYCGCVHFFGTNHKRRRDNMKTQSSRGALHFARSSAAIFIDWEFEFTDWEKWHEHNVFLQLLRSNKCCENPNCINSEISDN